MPRIIAGTKKKMTLGVPKGNIVRPTTDRVKENIFNIIGMDIVDSIFLDLFSGTGQIGLEALSRNAKSAVFVEKSKQVQETLKNNISKTGFTNYVLYLSDYSTFIENCKEKFDIIYVDPPYNCGIYDRIINKIAYSDILADNCEVLVEHDFKLEIFEKYGILEKYKNVRYSTTIISFFKVR